MPKPKYLDNPGPPRAIREAKKCVWCEHLGRPVKWTKHKGREKTAVYECSRHPGCMNTEHSLACQDWIPTSRPERLDVPQDL